MEVASISNIYNKLYKEPNKILNNILMFKLLIEKLADDLYWFINSLLYQCFDLFENILYKYKFHLNIDLLKISKINL